jgi:hypothetical protein
MKKPRKRTHPNQLLLGATADNFLTLVNQTPRRSAPSHRCGEGDATLLAALPFALVSDLELACAIRPPFPILRLPEELILAILTEAVCAPKASFERNPEQCKRAFRLCLTCTSFYRIVKPLLYSFITIYPSLVDPLTEKLTKVLWEDLSLAKHCQKLSVYMYDWEPSGFAVKSGLLREFVNVTSFKIWNGFDHTFVRDRTCTICETVWLLLQDVISAAKGIKDFAFDSTRGGFQRGTGLCLKRVCETMNGLRYLRSLSIYGISTPRGEREFALPKVRNVFRNPRGINLPTAEPGGHINAHYIEHL